MEIDWMSTTVGTRFHVPDPTIEINHHIDRPTDRPPWKVRFSLLMETKSEGNYDCTMLHPFFQSDSFECNSVTKRTDQQFRLLGKETKLCFQIVFDGKAKEESTERERGRCKSPRTVFNSFIFFIFIFLPFHFISHSAGCWKSHQLMAT